MAAALRDLLELDGSSVPGSDTFRALSARLLKERRRAAARQRFGHDPKRTGDRYFGPEGTCEGVRGSSGKAMDSCVTGHSSFLSMTTRNRK